MSHLSDGVQGWILWKHELYRSLTGSKQPLQQLTTDKRMYLQFNCPQLDLQQDDDSATVWNILLSYYLPEVFCCCWYPGPHLEFFGGIPLFERVFLTATMVGCGRESFESLKLFIFWIQILRSKILNSHYYSIT